MKMNMTIASIGIAVVAALLVIFLILMPMFSGIFEGLSVL